MGAAVCASLADLPGPVARGWQRVLFAGALACIAAAVIALLRPFAWALTPAVAMLAFASMMTIAWGVRAGPVAFAPVLSMVFTMALPVSAGSALVLTAANVAGALAYLAWSAVVTLALQRRYRSLALSVALEGTARLFRRRAALVREQPTDASLTPWIDDEALLAESLQSARDLLFVAPETPRAGREIAVLLHTIELRDLLLASRLDVELLGDDSTGRAVRERLAAALVEIATALDEAAAATRRATLRPRTGACTRAVAGSLGGLEIVATDSRARLLPALEDRLRLLAHDVQRIDGLLAGEAAKVPLSRRQLREFAAPEGWPLSALKAHFTMRSPVFRHAIRLGLALGSAHFAALLLPWNSHPHWLVLSVAVVLRGNLQQTLSRRNARVSGTVLGCLLVLLIASWATPLLMQSVFLAAVGVAHAFATVRYLVTAVAATVLALLQAHLVDPASGFAIGERLADTMLGALLAWAFSYVLPSWERRSLPRTLQRAMSGLREYALQVLRTDADAVEQRLARRAAYDSLAAIAGSVQRAAAEPLRVRPPLHELGVMLDHAQRLMAHLSGVRMLVVRRGDELAGAELTDALQAAREALQASLDFSAEPGQRLDTREAEALERLPSEDPADDPLPWLARRLRVAAADAREVRRAAGAALRALGAGGAKLPEPVR